MGSVNSGDTATLEGQNVWEESGSCGGELDEKGPQKKRLLCNPSKTATAEMPMPVQSGGTDGDDCSSGGGSSARTLWRDGPGEKQLIGEDGTGSGREMNHGGGVASDDGSQGTAKRGLEAAPNMVRQHLRTALCGNEPSGSRHVH